MKYLILLSFLSVVFPISAWAQGENQENEPADLVIINAKVLTMDETNPKAEAVAIKGENIIAVGSHKTISTYIKKGVTKVIDAKGRLVIPGFNDAHTHFNALDPDYIDLRYITDPNIITQRVKEKVAQAKPGELIKGGRWEHEMFTDRKWPTKELIDPVSPHNPVVLSRADGHSVLVNSYILKNSNITKDTSDPAGGEIQKDPKTGVPTGILKESAQDLIKTGAVPIIRTPEEEKERKIRGWQAAFDMAAKLGVTSIQIMTSSVLTTDDIDPDIFRQFQQQGKLTARIYLAGMLTDDDNTLKKYLEAKKQYPHSGNWIRFGVLKGFMDGTLGSATMMVFEPFVDEPSKTGLPQMSYEELERKVVKSDKLGFQIAIHAIGDKANHWILNAFAKAIDINGRRDSRHRSEHAQVLRLEDMPRFAQLGIIASMQPTHCITDKRFAEKRIGRERCRGAYAWRSLLNAKAGVAFGTDYPVEPLDPREGLYATVTRKDRAGETGLGWFPEQILSMEEAIKLYTLDSAYAEFMEDRKGMIKKGYLADLVIFGDDLLTIPTDQIMKARLDFTIVGGKVVYTRGNINLRQD